MVSGITVSTINAFGSLPCTLTRGVLTGESNTSAAKGRLPSVADKPHICKSGRQCASRASASCVCVPRLLPSSSCHSSTTTSFTCESTSRASGLVRISDRLSGVVISADGMRRFCRARSAEDVSPVRKPTVHGTGQFDRRALQCACRIGGKGAHRRDPEDGERLGLHACWRADASPLNGKVRLARTRQARRTRWPTSCPRPWLHGAGRSRLAPSRATPRAENRTAANAALRTTHAASRRKGRRAASSSMENGSGSECRLASVEPRLLLAAARNASRPWRAASLRHDRRRRNVLLVGINRLVH